MGKGWRKSRESGLAGERHGGGAEGGHGGGAECGLEEPSTSLRERTGVRTDWLVHSLRKLWLAPVTELARGSKAHR